MSDVIPMAGKLRVLDLFCGMGGLSLGFSVAGFEVTGVDRDKQVERTYSCNRLGHFINLDLTTMKVPGRYDIVIGGPPCEPWSSLNITRRKEKHPLHPCLKAFYRTVRAKRPKLFIMENVPAIQDDLAFLGEIEFLSARYDIKIRTIKYSDYGAATARRRLFALGVRRSLGLAPEEVFDSIKHDGALTVEKVIYDLGNAPDPEIDHVWPNLRTIDKYREYYKHNKFGWYVLNWKEPAPSFGNVVKTYILHPDSFNGNGSRAISVREAMRIVGFKDDFCFPPGTPMSSKYQMVADSVSPEFSSRLAIAVRDLLGRTRA